jgi:hypothetical protein
MQFPCYFFFFFFFSDSWRFASLTGEQQEARVLLPTNIELLFPSH